MAIKNSTALFVFTTLLLPIATFGQFQPGDSKTDVGFKLRASLGSHVEEHMAEASMDLNQDGIVNVLDIAAMRVGATNRNRNIQPATFNGTEQIILTPTSLNMFPSGTNSVLFLLRSNTTPLIGYSLDVRVVPEPGSMGTVTANVAATNFFDAQNIITAGGATRDPFFSVIQSNGNGGVFINTITDDTSTVISTPGVNDVFVQVFFDSSSDACGHFRLELGPATALSDDTATSIPFSFVPGSIAVSGSAACPVPTVSNWGVGILALLVATAGTVTLRARQRIACSTAPLGGVFFRTEE